MKNQLYYTKPAKCFEQALPLGNGRLGIMTYGNLRHERLSLNEDSLWSGYPKDQNKADAHKYLAACREAIFAKDYAKAKDILGRTATLEVRLVDDSPEALAQLAQGNVPFGDEKFMDREGNVLLVKRRVILTGENLNDAQPGFDSQTQEPTVNLELDSRGARIFQDVTRDNVGKRIAIILFEKGKGEVVTAPVIRQEIAGGRVQISGRMSTIEATDTALLLRAGSLAAPMEIVEERLIGPSLGADNIQAGFKSTICGFAIVAIFMMLYYQVFGVVSAVALMANVMCLVAILSMLQATLTLPGIAGIVLTLSLIHI